jgi:DNA gyrase subunit A
MAIKDNNHESLNETNHTEDNNIDESAKRIDNVIFDKHREYAISVIVDRAIPSLVDGLKPVQRRILYAVLELESSGGRRFVKSSRVTGDVNGKYHPHGDVAIYLTAVRMVRLFINTCAILDGQGNFGSSEYDAAAQRYTEMRSSNYAKEFFYYFDENYSEMQPNYDGTSQEPVFFVPRVPNLLINGSQGIAVGLRTNIPPHNVNECLQAVLMMLNNENVTLDELMTVIKGPDFPTYCRLASTSSIRKFYETGEGSLQITARYKIEDKKVVFYEVPYQCNKSELVKEIGIFADEDENSGIRFVRDETDKDGVRVVVGVKPGYDANVVANKVYQRTRMRVNTSFAFFAIGTDNKPRLYSLIEYLKEIIRTREESIFRQSIYLLEKHKKRLHRLVGFYVALQEIDDVVNKIRKSKSLDELKKEFVKYKWKCDESLNQFLASVGLQSNHGFYFLSEEQVIAILDMPLKSLNRMDSESVVKETVELKEKVIRLNELINFREKRYEILRKEYESLLSIYKDKRKSEIVDDNDDMDNLSLINPRSTIVTLNDKNYIKRIDVENNYKTQHLGGKGRTSGDSKLSIYCNTRDTMLFFLSSGKVMSKYVYEVPDGDHDFNGRAMVNILPIESAKDEVVCMFAYDSKNEAMRNINVLFIFDNGNVRRNTLNDFWKIKSSGKIYLNDSDDVRLLHVLFAENSDLLFIAKKHGKAACIPVGKFRIMKSRSSSGFKGCQLDRESGDEIVSALIVKESDKVLTVTSKGLGKIANVSDYSVTGRGAVGVNNLGKSKRSTNYVIACIKIDEEIEEVIITTSGGKSIRMSIKGLRMLSRNAVGVKFVNVGTDVVQSVIGVKNENKDK